MSSSSLVSSKSDFYVYHFIANASSIIKALPPEILGKIASFFDNCKDAVYLGLAHPRFYYLLSYAPLWHQFLQKDFSDSDVKSQLTFEKIPALYKNLMNADCNMKVGKFKSLTPLRYLNEKIDNMFVYEDMLIISSIQQGKNKIRVLDLKTEKELWTLDNPHSSHIFNILACADKLISYSNNTIQIRDLNTGKVLDEKRVGQRIICMKAHNGNLVAGLDDNTILVWNLDKAQEEAKILAGHQSWLGCMTICDGQLISGSRSGDTAIKIWDLETGKELHTLNKHWLSVNCLTVCNGELISGSNDNTIKIWNLDTKRELCTLHGHQDSVTCLLVYRGMLISGSNDNIIKIWDLKTRKELRTLNEGADGQDQSAIMSITTHNNQLISRTWHGQIKIWDLKTGKELLEVMSYQSDSQLPIRLAVHDGKLLANEGNLIKIWDFNLPHEGFPLLRELGILTEEGYSAILKCSPDDLSKRGIRSSEDLQILFNSPNLQRLEFIPEEVINDRLERQQRAFAKQKIVSDFLDQLLTAVQQKLEEIERYSGVLSEGGNIYQVPWITFQNELECYQASLMESGLTPQKLWNKFNQGYAKIVGEVNALVDRFHKLERGANILNLRAYIHQIDILEKWENLHEQGIYSLSALVKQAKQGDQ